LSISTHQSYNDVREADPRLDQSRVMCVIICIAESYDEFSLSVVANKSASSLLAFVFQVIPPLVVPISPVLVLYLAEPSQPLLAPYELE